MLTAREINNLKASEVPLAYKRLRITAVSISQTGEGQDSWDIRKRTHKWRIIGLRLNTALDPTNITGKMWNYEAVPK